MACPPMKLPSSTESTAASAVNCVRVRARVRVRVGLG